jgi:DNA-binding response OmpR family regulator
MAQTALGTHWAKATPEQQARFVKATETAEAKAYSERFGQYAGQTLAIGKTTSRPNGAFVVDSRLNQANGQPIKLTSHEYRLLAYLLHHNERVVSRTELVEHLYEQDFDRDSNTIEVFVGRIRKKLDVDIIQTVRGLGYLLTPPSPGA